MSSSPSNHETMVITDKIILNTTETLPSDTTVDLTAYKKNPLGLFEAESYFVANHSTVIEDNTVTITASVDDITNVVKPSKVVIDDDTVLAESNPDGSYQLYVDPGMVFEVKVNIPNNDTTPSLRFKTRPIHFYVSMSEVESRLGDFAVGVEDDDLVDIISDNSETAYELWTRENEMFEEVPPTVNEYVQVKTVYFFLQQEANSASGSSSSSTRKLGDLTIKEGSSTSSMLNDRMSQLNTRLEKLRKKLLAGVEKESASAHPDPQLASYTPGVDYKGLDPVRFRNPEDNLG